MYILLKIFNIDDHLRSYYNLLRDVNNDWSSYDWNVSKHLSIVFVVSLLIGKAPFDIHSLNLYSTRIISGSYCRYCFSQSNFGLPELTHSDNFVKSFCAKVFDLVSYFYCKNLSRELSFMLIYSRISCYCWSAIINIIIKYYIKLKY